MSMPAAVQGWLERFREADRLYVAGKISAQDWEARLLEVEPMPRSSPLPGSVWCPACRRNVLVTAVGRLRWHRVGTLVTDERCRLSLVSLRALCTCAGECRRSCELCPQLPFGSPCPEEVK